MHPAAQVGWKTSMLWSAFGFRVGLSESVWRSGCSQPALPGAAGVRVDSPPRRPQWPFAFLAATGVQALPVSEFRRALLNGCQPALSLGAPDRCSRWPPLPTGPPFGSRPLSMAENRKMPCSVDQTLLEQDKKDI